MLYPYAATLIQFGVCEAVIAEKFDVWAVSIKPQTFSSPVDPVALNPVGNTPMENVGA
tara:strand:+ start:465 stop:638 length:174 start_codon:yes stop_codon:yes gene_type:complete